jgi:hypothetical protein
LAPGVRRRAGVIALFDQRGTLSEERRGRNTWIAK